MITKYTKKDGSTAYKLQAYLGVDQSTGKQVRTTRQGFKTIKEAKRAEVKLVEDFNRQGVWKNSDKTTFDEVAQLWFEQYANTVRESTYTTSLYNYNKKIKPFLGNKCINKINVMICQKLINQLANHAAYMSYISVINRIFKFAINIGIIDLNPMDKTIRAKNTHIAKSETKNNFYSKEEFQKFLDKADEIYGLEMLVYFRILGFGGLRNGEALVLQDSDFDFKNNTISINKTNAYAMHGLMINKPKTKKSNRVVSMDIETMRLAKKYIRQSIKPLHETFRLYNYTPQTIAFRIKKVADSAGLKRISPHGLRHTHASLLFEAGIPAKVIQERLGHSKISMTLDTYTHLSKSQTDDTANQLAKFIAL
ncbi:site-specific integrase [Streptococcus parauberis]|uniref:site-specific integrase n=1 Tax=Streptococcus parauberis TaxID=1348 RepID=UPI00020CBC19|nr:site-specific integrase [Streptococcus parauberis]AEF25751.1 putative integrase - phage associated [Streptococcus parauberis KCTC 11537]QBX27399.1 mobile element protein [Streptococcus phage Javan384]UWM92135.1 site-specific integrase [Streptococcus parauberis]